MLPVTWGPCGSEKGAGGAPVTEIYASAPQVTPMGLAVVADHVDLDQHQPYLAARFMSLSSTTP